MAKRVIERIWAQKRRGGWVLPCYALRKALQKGDILEFGGIQVGAREFRSLVNLLPGYDFRVVANGRLEVETIEQVSKRQPDGTFRVGFRKPKEYNAFNVVPGAWLPLHEPAKLARMTVVVIKPRKIPTKKE